MISEDKIRKIWYQGFTDPEIHSVYINKLQAHLDKIAGQNTSITFFGISPPASHLHPVEELRCSLIAMKNALRAEEEGYDAFVMGHFQEAGIHEIKSMVNIPVLSLGEATLLHSCTLGKKIGLVTIDPIFIPWHEEQIQKAGLEKRVIGVEAMDTSPAFYMEAFSNRESCQIVIDQFKTRAQILLDKGADVLVPAGGLPMLLLAENGLAIFEDAPVINGINVLVKLIEVAIFLYEIDGLGVSRKSSYKLPSESALKEFKSIL
tara:strand:+ start:1411 stop:2196 length:786 start_codon:yes stop_codon:yes gene_type:complete